MTPTPEALALALRIIGPCTGAPLPHEYPVEWCTTCRALMEDMDKRIALALTEQAGGIGRATWEAAAKFVDANRCRDSFRMATSCGHVLCEYSRAVAAEFRVRAAAQGGMT